MDVDLPKYHNLKNYCDLKETGHYLRTWEISVPSEDSFEWSIVLSHLTTANLRNEEDFKTRLSDLTEECEDTTLIKKCISSFNPFLNRYSCFYNKSLQRVLHSFKEKLRRAAEEEMVIKSRNFKQEKSSSFLKSHVILITATENGDLEILDTFPKDRETHNDGSRITLYLSKNSDNQEKYTFGLKKERGIQLKRAAFNKILKEANVLKKRRNALFLLEKEGESFVTSVLRSDCKSSISYLYKSSYLAWKLVEAGYEMDPRVLDSSGFSAFYHALTTGDETYTGDVYILHNYAANACHQTDKTFRNPDEFILKNLKVLGEIISNDKEKSNDFTSLIQNEKAKLNASQLIRFNDFLIQMCENILEEKSICVCSLSQAIFETTMRKNVILVILKTYDSFFFFDENALSTDCSIKLDDYCNYDNYYRNLDYSATLYFFDNIFRLKERLQLCNNEYSDLESNFFLYVLSNKYFSNELFKYSVSLHKNSQYQKSFNDYKNLILNSSCKTKDFKIISLVQRSCLRQKIKEFILTLSQIDIGNTNVLHRLPEEEIPKTLASLPDVKDELEIRRLSHYLEIAMKQNVESQKQVLIIERTLQVLGEFIIKGRKTTNNLCFLLSVCLPEKISRLLKQTRNILTHLVEYSFRSKLKVEKNTSLFNGIKEDIKKIHEIFKGIFDMQELRLIEFLFKRGIQQISENVSLVAATGSLLDTAASPWELALARLQGEFDMVCEIKSNPCYKNRILKNHDLLQNLSSVIDKRLKNEHTWRENCTQNVEEILWPLKCLLTLIDKSCKDLNFVEMEDLIKESDDILLHDSDAIKKKMEGFWKKYKNLLSKLCRTTNRAYNEELTGASIKKFKKVLKGFNYFSASEEEEIRKKIPQSVRESVSLRYDMQKSLELGNHLTHEQVKRIPTLFLSKRNMKALKQNYTNIPTALEIIKSASDPILQLDTILDEGCSEMGKDALKQLCDRLQCSKEVRDKLYASDLGQKQIPLENAFANILNRINLLREILIEENPNIRELWNKAKNARTQKYAEYKIVQRFLRDPDVQASVEMLLYDCMIILGKETDMETLWIKASSLFSGINLRNVLGHGNPTLETVGKLLDPDDLPSVLVKEMLYLIKDESAIKTIYDLSEQTNSDFDLFQKIINDEEDIEHCEMRTEILQCERWRRYSKLLKRDKSKCDNLPLCETFPLNSDSEKSEIE